jgi:amino acid transporter
MDRLQFLYFMTVIGNILIFFVLARVWWLKLAPLYQILIVFITVRYPIIGFIWYLVVFIRDRRIKKKKKEENKRKREERKMKKKKEKEKEKEKGNV